MWLVTPILTFSSYLFLCLPSDLFLWGIATKLLYKFTITSYPLHVLPISCYRFLCLPSDLFLWGSASKLLLNLPFPHTHYMSYLSFLSSINYLSHVGQGLANFEALHVMFSVLYIEYSHQNLFSNILKHIQCVFSHRRERPGPLLVENKSKIMFLILYLYLS